MKPPKTVSDAAIKRWAIYHGLTPTWPLMCLRAMVEDARKMKGKR